jgi:hypothetical protein
MLVLESIHQDFEDNIQQLSLETDVREMHGVIPFKQMMDFARLLDAFWTPFGCLVLFRKAVDTFCGQTGDENLNPELPCAPISRHTKEPTPIHHCM